MATEPSNRNESAAAIPEPTHANSIELLDLEPARALWRKWLALLDQWEDFAAAHDRDADELERIGRRGAAAARARAEWCRGRAARARIYLARFQARIDVLTGLPS